MKTKTFLFTLITMFLLIGGMGCEKDVSYYSGTIVTLDSNNGCFDIIRIDEAPQDGLGIKTTISFNANSLSTNLKLNDVMKFEIISYQKLIDTQSTLCPHPDYNAIIKLHND